MPPSLSRPSLLLVSGAVAATLAIAGPGADGTTPSFTASHARDTARIVDLGGHGRVELTPLGTTGRTLVNVVSGAASTGVIATTTSAGTTLSPAGGGRPTVVDGSAKPAVATQADDTRADDPQAEDPQAEDPQAEDTVALTLKSVGRDGREAFAHVNILDLTNGTVWNRQIPGSPDTGHDCTTDTWAESDCVLLAPGDYSVMAFVTTEPAQSPPTETGRTAQSVALVGDPQVHLTAARQVTLDARRAHRLDIDTPGHGTARVNDGGLMQLGYRQTAANGQALDAALRPAFLLDNHVYLQPTEKPTVGSFSTLTRVQLTAPDIRLRSKQTGRLHPAYYDAVWFSDVASDFPMYDGSARLRAVDVGRATKRDLRGRHLHGAIAVVQRSDDLSVAEQSNNAAAAGARLVAIYNDKRGDNEDPNGTGIKLRVPTVRLDRAEGHALLRLKHGARVKVHGQPASPYLYDLVIKKNGAIPAHFHRTYRDRDLATQVRALHGQPRIDSTFSEAAYQYQPGDTFSISTMMPFRGGPRARTEFRIADPDTRWSYAETSPESSYNALFPDDPPVEEMAVSAPRLRTYRPGRTTRLPSLTAPITAEPNPGAPVQRDGDRMRIYLDGFTDADGNHGSAYSDVSGMATHLEVDADGTPVAETDNLPYGYAALPSGDSHVAIHFTTANPQSWNRLSTHTDTTWAFPSSTTTEAVDAPVLVPDYDVPVDLRNRVEAGKKHRAAFDLAVAHADGSDSPIDDLTLDASWDGGGTWIPASVTATGSGWHVVLPKGSGFVALRLHAADAAGSTVDQTVVRAFLVR
jgi:hypothetical protein